MNGTRVATIVAVMVLVVAACSPAASVAPGSTSGGGASVAPAPSAAATSAPVATTSATQASADDLICATAVTMGAALTKLNALDLETASDEDIRAAVHDVGQAGAQLIVQGAKADHLQALNIGAQFTLSILDSKSTSDSDKRQAIQQFANTAQTVLDELTTCG